MINENGSFSRLSKWKNIEFIRFSPHARFDSHESVTFTELETLIKIGETMIRRHFHFTRDNQVFKIEFDFIAHRT